jgi:hypothetical protein
MQPVLFPALKLVTAIFDRRIAQGTIRITKLTVEMHRRSA